MNLCLSVLVLAYYSDTILCILVYLVVTDTHTWTHDDYIFGVFDFRMLIIRSGLVRAQLLLII